jgi:hypothetical protein
MSHHDEDSIRTGQDQDAEGHKRFVRASEPGSDEPATEREDDAEGHKRFVRSSEPSPDDPSMDADEARA